MNKVDKIVIVGGGSAGWMTACSLIHAFPDKDITLIESPDVPKIGVGESTLAGLPAWLNAIEVNHEDFMSYTDASYKLSIKFNNFYEIGDGGFHYPFGEPNLSNTVMDGANDWHILKHFVPETTKQSYVDSIFPQSVLLDTGKMYEPKKDELYPFNLKRDYALHFDAIKFADWLSEKYAKPRGVKHVQSIVKDIIANDEGVEKLVLQDGTEITSDLFVDCTGFKSLLLGGAMKEPFMSHGDKLPVNKTWAIQIQYDNAENEIQNFTDCTALGHGWVWNAPLYSRIGTGYVYSDRFTTPEEALIEFKQYLTDRFGANRVPDDSMFRNIDFKAGIYERTWVKNVVGIGLSAAFLEPLESNGLFFIHETCMMLNRFLQRGFVNQIDIDFFNTTVREHFDGFSSFIEYHYVLSKRRDTEFWKYMTERPFMTSPKNQTFYNYNKYVNEFQRKTSSQVFVPTVFSGWHAIAVGMEYSPIGPNSVLYWEYHNPENDYKQIAGNFYIRTEKLRKEWLKAIENAPSHYQYLKKKFHSGEQC
jgi:tryptophan halogenase